MSIERALLDLLPLANPAQDPDNTLKIPDFESGGPFKTTIWQKGHNSGDLAMSIQIKGIKANGKQYDFTSPVTIGAIADALKDAIEQLYKDNQDELGLAKVRVINGPSAYESWVVYIVSGVAVEALIDTADSEFTGIPYSGVTDPYTVTIEKAVPVNEENYALKAYGLIDGKEFLAQGIFLADDITGDSLFESDYDDISYGPFSYSGVEATDLATAASIKNAFESAMQAQFVSGGWEGMFQKYRKPEEVPTIDVLVNAERSGFDIEISGVKSGGVYSGTGFPGIYVTGGEVRPTQIGTTQLIV